MMIVNHCSLAVALERTVFPLLACKQTLFYFSFRSFQKHRRARTRTTAEREKEK